MQITTLNMYIILISSAQSVELGIMVIDKANCDEKKNKKQFMTKQVFKAIQVEEGVEIYFHLR